MTIVFHSPRANWLVPRRPIGSQAVVKCTCTSSRLPTTQNDKNLRLTTRANAVLKKYYFEAHKQTLENYGHSFFS